MFKQYAFFKNNILVMLFFVGVIAYLFTQIPTLRQITIYKADLVQEGQAWRLVTGPFVHINIWHLAGNLIGLYFVMKTDVLSNRTNALVFKLILCSIAGTSFLYFLSPETKWYCGLSGPLHALWTWNAAQLIVGSYFHYDLAYARKARTIGMIFLLGVLIKLLYEWNVDPITLFSNLTDYPVLTISHRFGALAGLLLCSIAELVRAKTRFLK